MSRRSRTRPPFEFNPQSFDAQFAKLLAETQATRAHISDRMDTQDKTLEEIKQQALKTNGRVGVLEIWKETSKAKLAGIALTVGAVGGVLVWLAQILFR